MSAEPTVRFRKAEPQDAPAVGAIVRAAYAKWVPIIGREPRPMTADYDVAIRDNLIDIACIGERIVGLIEMMIRTDHLWIENLAVDPDHQGLGLGRGLLSRGEARAIQAGLSETRLLTNSAFESNIGLYERAGYAIVGREPFMGGTTIYMNKKLGQ